MKLQTLTVLFIIIILPITLVVSQFIETEISTINKQTNYDAILTNATYDAIEAFQINESSSSTSDITTEKMRDVKASIQSFYNSLATAMGTQGYTEEDLQGYIPCLIYGLYDGYYIYTTYTDEDENGTKQTKYGLKPYVYYTEKITKDNNNNLTITYTLDNYIIITGIYNGESIAMSGYLISNEYDDFIKENENLSENIYSDGDMEYKENVPYVYKKFDSNGNEVTNGEGQCIKYYNIENVWYSYGADGKLKKETNEKILNNLGSDSSDTSANKYKSENSKFSFWVSNNLNSFKNSEDKLCNYLNIDNNNNPDKYSSPFNEHRREVIKKSIQSNLERTLYNFRDNGKIDEFEMPEIDETHWDMIINNVSLISFMQGLPLKNKLYSGYSVVTNTESKEFVDPDEIYIITGNNNNNNYNTYHKYIWKGFNNSQIITGAYRNIEFKTRKQGTDSSGVKYYYYPHFDSADYDSIITSTNVEGPDLQHNKNAIEVVTEKATNNNYLKNAAEAYYTALYRERYVNYKSLNFGFTDPDQ